MKLKDEIDFALRWVFGFVLLVAFLHVAIWMATSFVFWDVYYLTPASHRLLFVLLCLFAFNYLNISFAKGLRKGIAMRKVREVDQRDSID